MFPLGLTAVFGAAALCASSTLSEPYHSKNCKSRNSSRSRRLISRNKLRQEKKRERQARRLNRKVSH